MTLSVQVRALRRFRLAPLFAVLLLIIPAPTMQADGPGGLTESQIKAGFIFNFLRFVEWPPKAFGTSSTPITVCVVGDSPITALLNEAVAGKTVEGRAVAVKHLQPADESHGCHLVFVSAAEAHHSSRMLDSLKGASVLTVGEVAGFSQSGGILNFSTQDNRVKLELNLDAAAHANLKISAKLIAVSRLVNEKSTQGVN